MGSGELPLSVDDPPSCGFLGPPPGLAGAVGQGAVPGLMGMWAGHGRSVGRRGEGLDFVRWKRSGMGKPAEVLPLLGQGAIPDSSCSHSSQHGCSRRKYQRHGEFRGSVR